MKHEPEFEINELSWFQETFSFEGPDGGLVVPTTVHWQLWNMTADTEVQAWTSLTPATQIVLVVSGLLHEIVDEANERELFQLLVHANREISITLPLEIYYDVVNVPNLGGTSP